MASPSTQCTNSHSLPRVASPPTYADKTINPNIRRRKAKIKSLTRDSFPIQAVEKEDNELPLLPPPDEDITLPAILPPITSPTLSPPIEPTSIPPPVDLPPNNTSSSTGNVGYKFLKFFSATKTSAKVVIIREKSLQ